jgi:hypothetical protein
MGWAGSWRGHLRGWGESFGGRGDVDDVFDEVGDGLVGFEVDGVTRWEWVG